jgi:4-amino-4-deoxy-L-arabinose transferase-like glycosyltransferase
MSRVTPLRLPIIALYLYLAGSAPFLGQWDSFDYLKQIVSHELSSLGIGRPVYLGYNILLWESMRKLFDLGPLRVEIVAMAGTVLIGGLGVFLFQRLACRILPAPAGSMAALALAVSPVYAIYAGFIMTEVPMLVALIGAALILWQPGGRRPILEAVAAGILFGLAVGIREQALTLGGAYLWILLCRHTSFSDRARSMLLFGFAAACITATPAAIFYLLDPAGFVERIQTWFHAIPMGSVQFRNNMEASLLFAFVVSPGIWLAVAGAGIYRLFGKKTGSAGQTPQSSPIRYPFLGILCCLVLPVAILWRDADVQMHPRYLLLTLPASAIWGAALFRRWIASKRGVVVWAVVQVLLFGLALAAFSPYRQAQIQKMEFARSVRESVPGAGLFIAGNYSPILDYYRGIGLRPNWQIQWSGWDWNHEGVAAKIYGAWASGIPVYLSTEPRGWSYFERELLDAHLMLKDHAREPILPHLYRIYPK